MSTVRRPVTFSKLRASAHGGPGRNPTVVPMRHGIVRNLNIHNYGVILDATRRDEIYVNSARTRS